MLARKRKASVAESSRKKKTRNNTRIRPVPEERRILRSGIFFYVPPDDKAPLRRNRINKAVEFGATWAKELTVDVTHIIVERPLTRKDVVDFLKVETLPEGVIMVNDDYPIDCINSRFFLDPVQRRYAVYDPRDSSQHELNDPSRSPSLEASLQLKAAKQRKGGHVHQDQTPPRSSDLISAIRSDAHSGDPLDTRTSFGGDLVVESFRAMSPSALGSHVNQDSIPPHDELDEMIEVAQMMGGVPLDDEEDEKGSERPPSRDTPDSSGFEDDSKIGGKERRGKQETLSKQENYRCMTRGTGLSAESNPNAKTIDTLQQMCDYYGRIKDEWRERSYRIAIGVLKKQSVKITTYNQAVELHGIGLRLGKKIEEIALTARLRRLENVEQEPNDRTLQSFMKVYGVGLKEGWKWVLQGHKTLEDLKNRAHLTKNQRLGIEHYDDFSTRIPREEVTKLGDIVISNSAIVDPEVKVIIGGSYRRGAPTSGDIDCMLTKPGTSSGRDLSPYLNKLVGRLTDIGFLTAALAVSSEGSGSKWHGCCVLLGSPKPIWRRIDLLLVPETQLGAALIYFTGDDIFNRSIRLLARRKGCRLNQKGLYKDVMRIGQTKLNEGTLLEGADEEKIFALLGVPWRPPHQRICS